MLWFDGKSISSKYTVIEGNEKILPVENNIALLIGTKIGLVEEKFFIEME